jgi:hypothetical protein
MQDIVSRANALTKNEDIESNEKEIKEFDNNEYTNKNINEVEKQHSDESINNKIYNVLLEIKELLIELNKKDKFQN